MALLLERPTRPDGGFINQNVPLFCAPEGLATVFCGALDADKLGRT
jgi:hypothetical protein